MDNLRSFFVSRLNRQTRELYTSTIILDFAVSMISVFEPVFLFSFFSKHYDLKLSLQFILLFYLAIYIPYFFSVPFGAKFAKKFGYEYSIALGTVFNVAMYFFLFSMNRWELMAFPAVITYILSKLFYWPAYHSDFARYAVDGEQGRAISNLSVLLNAVYIAGPLIGGLIINFFGFKILFIVASALMLVSNIPMLVTKEEFVPSTFDYQDAYKRIFSKKHRRQFLAHWGYGEEIIGIIFWPIFIYLIVGSYLGLGSLTALATLLTSLIFLYIGKVTDKKDRRAVMRFGTILHVLGWLFRVVARSVFGVFLIDTYSRVSKQTLAVPITAVTYGLAQESSVMKTVLFFEMSLVFGKILAMIGCLALLQIFNPGWNAMFVLAGGMTLLYLLF